MIPAGQFDPKRASALFEYLIEEYRRARRDRKGLEDKWVDWKATYQAEPVEEQKTFPFVGASNLVIPVMATEIDMMFSRFMGLLFEPEGLYSMTATNPEMAPFAPRMTEFMQWAQHNEIDFEGPVGSFLLEMMKLGTGVLKQRYHREVQKVFEWREVQGQTWQQQALLLMKDAPALHWVPLHKFWIPAGYTDIQDAPWVGETIDMSFQRFRNRVNAGLYQGADRIHAWQSNYRGGQVQQEYDRLSGYSPSQGSKVELVEFWTSFDIDGDGWDEALVCTIHPDSESYVRLDFNPFFNQDKPYSAARYMKDEDSFYGIGLGRMLMLFQEEVSAMHNQRIDNGTVQNSQTFAVKKDNKNIRADEPIYPSKVWLVNDPKDVLPIPLGSTSSGQSIQNENFTLNYAQRRVGSNDFMHAQGGPETAYGTAFATQQLGLNSTRRQGEVMREIRRALAESGTRILELYQQFNQRGKEYFALGANEGELVRMILQFPMDLIRRGLKVNVRALDASESKDSKLRTNQLIMQQVMAFYGQLMQAAAYLGNPQVPPIVQQLSQQMMTGGLVLMRQMLEDYNRQDIDKIIPDLTGGVSAQQQQLAELHALVQRAGAVGIGPGGAPGAAAQPGMGAGADGYPGAGIGGIQPPALGGGVAVGGPVAGQLGGPGLGGITSAGPFGR